MQIRVRDKCICDADAVDYIPESFNRPGLHSRKTMVVGTWRDIVDMATKVDGNVQQSEWVSVAPAQRVIDAFIDRRLEARVRAGGGYFEHAMRRHFNEDLR